MYGDEPVNAPTAFDKVELHRIGRDLARPESVLTHQSGLVFCSDWTGAGGVAVITPAGQVRKIQIADPNRQLRPNGIALEPGGSFVIAHLGAIDGGAYRLHPDGSVEPLLLEVDGQPLPPSNFPIRDRQGRLWLTISTRKSPRADDYRANASSGFIVLQDERGARIVADGLGYTNEIAFSADGKQLFVNETFARRLTRFDVAEDGTLTSPQVVWRFGAGDYPDGLVLDEDGYLWVTSIVSNRVIRINPVAGTASVIVEDSVAAHVDAAEVAYQRDQMGRPHLDSQPAGTLRNISSLAFGGFDLSTAYLGCLLGDRLFRFATPTRGLRPLHYDYDISPLLQVLDL
jgi:sugar lactone lactonase YvrE